MDQQRDNPLGQEVDYRDTYDASLLFPIARATNRETIGIHRPLPFHGYDIWNAYELSWLDSVGKPCVAVAEIYIPCASENIVESKSLKLYLNSFSQTAFNRQHDVMTTIKRDLSECVGANIDVHLLSMKDVQQRGLVSSPGVSLDQIAMSITQYDLDPSLLELESQHVVEEVLSSDLFKSNCPVTQQPDWASVLIHYQGPKIKREGLLAYLLSYRQHTDFHEHCIERIFMDLKAICQCERLTVQARFTRRGGLDINPFRSNFAGHPDNTRLARQ